MSKTIEELKQEAKDLGIRFVPNISAEKLSAKIEEFYESQETSDTELQEALDKKAKENSEEKSVVGDKPAKRSLAQRAKEMEARARETVIVTIIDNDTRENNQTTVAVVNCSNEWFDLGTVYIPLNVPIEVKRGHLNVLKEIEIPLHTLNPKSGLNEIRLRPRYSISIGSEF